MLDQGLSLDLVWYTAPCMSEANFDSMADPFELGIKTSICPLQLHLASSRNTTHDLSTTTLETFNGNIHQLDTRIRIEKVKPPPQPI